MKKDRIHWVEFQQYHKPEAQSLIEQTKQQLSQAARDAGRRDAENQSPRQGEKLQPYLAPTLLKVPDLVAELRNLHRAEENVDLSIAKQKRILEQSRNKRDEMQLEHGKIARKVKASTDGFPTPLAFGLLILIAGVGLAEGYVVLDVVRYVITPSLLGATVVSLIYGLSLAFFAHLIHTWWYISTKRIITYSIRAGIISGLSLVFYFFGYMRSGMLEIASIPAEEYGSKNIFTEADPKAAFMFMCLSWLIFLCGVFIAKYTPTKEEWVAMLNIRKLRRELHNSSKKLEAQHQLIRKTEDEISHLREYEASRNKTAQRDEERTLSLIENIRANYIQSNIRHRVDKTNLPKCFEEPIDYPVNTYFQHFKSAKR